VQPSRSSESASGTQSPLLPDVDITAMMSVAPCPLLLLLAAVFAVAWLGCSRVVASVSPSASNGHTVSARHNWGGADSFFLFALSESDRLEHLAAMQSAGMKVVRIFISGVGDGAKGSSSTATPDVEPKQLGVWDDTILERIDRLMYESLQYGVKLDISMHDRYALGCWAEDAYYFTYHFPSGFPGCNAQKNDVHSFYQNSSIEAVFDHRLIHIVTHRNPLMGNRTWGELSEVIFTFAAQNEAQSFIPSRDWDWACRRAKTMRPHLAPGILLSTNGATVADSLQTQLFECPELDLMAVHNYGGGEKVAANYSMVARQLAETYNKRVYVEEFGATGDNNGTKAVGLQQQIDGILSAHIPFMFWELVKTNPPLTDYEVWTGCKAWDVIANRSQLAAVDTDGAFAWPELFPPSHDTVHIENPIDTQRTINISPSPQ
jgi:mannan endo-1,4-beta-mannosidase